MHFGTPTTLFNSSKPIKLFGAIAKTDSINKQRVFLAKALICIAIAFLGLSKSGINLVIYTS